MEVEGRRGAEAEPGGDADDERGGGVRAAASHAGEGPRGGGRGRPRRAGAASGWSSLSRRARRARLGPHELGGIWRAGSVRPSPPSSWCPSLSSSSSLAASCRAPTLPRDSPRYMWTTPHPGQSPPRTKTWRHLIHQIKKGRGVTKKLLAVGEVSFSHNIRHPDSILGGRAALTTAE
ncbi:uncharacterized protein LOC119268006 [Triticum dicoccoides]|uniref:uncharacterized protein LOC119268006 n=1 Tax=Triticum dicoccoides TaxID=85692 RepID=UPI00188DD449|nr:uncharacterized protein LOC119268006 [Triticum dicoccoides]